MGSTGAMTGETGGLIGLGRIEIIGVGGDGGRKV
jgi:hypothetical protein